MDLLKGLSLFSGIGGIDLALKEFCSPVCYCEIEPYCQSILLQRMQEGYLPKAPIWDDIRTLSADCDGHESSIDIVYGGFPCQGFSCAGAGKGLEDERSGLFFQVVRLAKEIKPKFIFFENVPAITTRGGLRVVREIAEMGYDCRWCVISAASVGALHKRERWFLLAYSKIVSSDVANTSSPFTGRHYERTPKAYTMSPYCCINGNTNSITGKQTDMRALPERKSRETWGNNARVYWPFESKDDWQKAVSDVCRITDGLPRGVDRLKSLGNSVVPQQVRKAFMILTGLYETTRKDQ